MAQLAVIDDRDITITPVFMWIELENVPQSEAQGRPVMENKEVVEVRFAGSKLYSPRFPVDAQYQRIGNQVVTYAERWPEQYAAFKAGNQQEAHGTPLEMLRTYNVTPEQLSLCRALRIYSVEALHRLEGPGIKALGVHANALREAAKAFLADRDQGRNAMDEVALLRAEIERLKANMVPAVDSTPADIEAAKEAADASYADMTDADIKDEIERLTKARPRGNPNRATLENMLTQALAA